MLKELTCNELSMLLSGKENIVLHFFTPFCGTCQLAEKMLDIVVQSGITKVPVYKCNLSYHQNYVKQWKIEQAPTILFIKNGEVIEKVYAVESVSKLYSLFQAIYDQI